MSAEFFGPAVLRIGTGTAMRQSRTSVRARNRKARVRRRSARALGWSAAVLMCGVGAWLLMNVGAFEWAYHGVGSDLESHIQSDIAAAAIKGQCKSGSGPVGTVDGFDLEGNLLAPSISLRAPVVQGTGSAQLAAAVGHDPASTWPSTEGTTVLSGHDVTWFSGLGGLQPGAEIDYQTVCSTYQYLVLSSQVVKAGTPLATSDAGRLALVTCYPLNALYLTANRLVVEAELVNVRYRPEGLSAGESFAIPEVNAPAALLHQGLDVAHNSAGLGSLEIAGAPTPAWRQSDAPLGTHIALLALYFGTLRSAQQNQPGWWSQLAPGVPFSLAQALVGKTVETSSNVDATLQVDGSTVTGATLSATLQFAHGATTANVAMTAAVDHGDFVVSSWRMTTG
jgi:sortase A